MLVRIALLPVWLALPSAALADKCVALAIGDSDYQQTPKLANSKNDAVDVSAALRKLGFQVIEPCQTGRRVPAQLAAPHLLGMMSGRPSSAALHCTFSQTSS